MSTVLEYKSVFGEENIEVKVYNRLAWATFPKRKNLNIV